MVKRSFSFVLAVCGGYALFNLIPGLFLALLCSGSWALFIGWFLK